MIKPKHFISLHAHDGSSVFDGFKPPKDHFDFVLENGMNAHALTNHGNMNSWAEAFLYAKELKKKGIDFKYIPGVEFYFHPSLKEWQDLYNKNQEDKAAAKAIKDQEKKEAKKKKKDEVEQVLETIIMDDEEETGSVIENEDESKKRIKNPLKRRHHLVALAKNSEGLRDLFSLVSQSYIVGQYYYPRTDFAMLKSLAKKGNIVFSTACVAGLPAWEILDSTKDIPYEELTLDKVLPYKNEIMRRLRNDLDMFVDAVGKENFNLELQFLNLEIQHITNYFLMELSKESGIPLLATCDAHYPRPDSWKQRELYKRLGFIAKNMDLEPLPESVDDLKAELYPKNADQMWDAYLKYKDQYSFYDDQIICDAIERSYDIAHHQIESEIEPDRSVKLPSFVVPEDEKPFGALVKMAEAGLEERGLSEKQEYIDRLLFELDIVKKKKFAKYFLTVKKILDIAREHMLLGFGRGSAAGSLLAYCLKITDVDPIKHNLLFTRFIDLSRDSLPDIDNDISDRDLLLKLLRQDFGKDNVIPISNWNTLGLKSLIKDVSKFYNIDYQEVNSITRFLDKEIIMGAKGDGVEKADARIDFDNAIKYSVNFNGFIKKYPEVGELLKDLEGEIRSVGKHAGGVIIAENIADQLPLIMSKKELQTPYSESTTVSQLEPFGFVKIDLLGLETLKMFEHCIAMILQRHHGINRPSFKQIRDWYEKNLAPSVLDLDDQKVFENVWHKAKYAGVFQCSQKETQKYFTKAKPTSVGEIGVLTSLYRPGPMGIGAHERYIKNKENYVPHHNKIVEEVLGETFNILTYQEQAMLLASRLGGISDQEVNIFRKLISKKPKKEDPLYKKFLELRDKFVAGAIQNGLPEIESIDLFDAIEEFAKYSFNKCLWEDTPVETKTRGYVKIKDVKKGEYVNSKNGFVKVLDVICQGEKELVRFIFNNKELIATVDHKIDEKNGLKPLKDIMSDCLYHYDLGPTRTDIWINDPQNKINSKNGFVYLNRYYKFKRSQTYDLEVDHPDHTFYANDISVSNSHAISYSINSYICAWLLTYYTPEWLCAYVETRSDNPDKKAEAIAEIKALGYKIEQLDINQAIDRWSIVSKKSLMPSITSCKGIGGAGFEELVLMRPYKSIYDLLWNEDGSFKHSKFNKRCMETLIKIEALSSLDCVGPDKLFSSYAQMHEVVIGNWDLLRKKLKKDTFETQVQKLQDLIIANSHIEPWLFEQKVEFFKEITGEVNMDFIISDKTQKQLYKKGYVSIEEFPEEETETICWFIVDDYTKKKTKTGKTYLSLLVSGVSGKQTRMNCWNWNESHDVKKLRAYIALVKQNSFGYSIVIEDMMMLPNS